MTEKIPHANHDRHAPSEAASGDLPDAWWNSETLLEDGMVTDFTATEVPIADEKEFVMRDVACELIFAMIDFESSLGGLGCIHQAIELHGYDACVDAISDDRYKAMYDACFANAVEWRGREVIDELMRECDEDGLYQSWEIEFLLPDWKPTPDQLMRLLTSVDEQIREYAVELADNVPSWTPTAAQAALLMESVTPAVRELALQRSRT
jgi:hypothetical protein